MTPNYPQYKIPLNLKLTMVSMEKNGKTNTAMFRALINGIFNDTPDQYMFGNANAEILIEKFPIIDACRGRKKTEFFFFKVHF